MGYQFPPIARDDSSIYVVLYAAQNLAYKDAPPLPPFYPSPNLSGSNSDIIPEQKVADNDTSIPPTLRANWYRFVTSGLPERVFNELMSSAVRLEKAPHRKRSPLSSRSLSSFLDFWQTVKGNCAEPVVSLTPQGEVVAEWFKDPDNSLVIMAHRSKELYFSLFDKGMPVEGKETVSRANTLVKMLAARGTNPFLWSDADEN